MDKIELRAICNGIEYGIGGKPKHCTAAMIRTLEKTLGYNQVFSLYPRALIRRYLRSRLRRSKPTIELNINGWSRYYELTNKEDIAKSINIHLNRAKRFSDLKPVIIV